MVKTTAILALVAAAGCDSLDTAELPEPEALGVTRRDDLGGGIAHYSLSLKLGAGANDSIRIHRVVRESSPWHPARSRSAVMLLHGDFSSFATNFIPRDDGGAAFGLASDLAGAGIDVWGFDRRWTGAAPGEADLEGYPDMGIDQELDDVDAALSFARGFRAVTGAGAGRLILGGFSRGGHLGYAYAARDGARPGWRRKLAGLVVLDMYAEIDPADTALRDAACARAAEERALLDAGVVESDNSFFAIAGELALSAPDEISPLFGPPYSNRYTLLILTTQTYFFFQASAFYHLAAGSFDELGEPVALTESDEGVIGRWFAGAAHHQSMREVTESDELWCGQSPPVEVDLSDVVTPLLYVGAAGGIGDAGLYTTTRVSSTDVTAGVIARFGPEGAAGDFGHGDLLFAGDAAELVSVPLANWIARH